MDLRHMPDWINSKNCGRHKFNERKFYFIINKFKFVDFYSDAQIDWKYEIRESFFYEEVKIITKMNSPRRNRNGRQS